jgi:hypothetical protein
MWSGLGRPRLAVVVLSLCALTASACSREVGPATVAGPVTHTTQPVPPHLVFTAQPTTATAGRVMDTVVVSVLDSAGGLVALAGDTITIAVAAEPGPANLSGTLRAPVIGGVASFGDLSLDQPGGGYVLSASSSDATVAAATSMAIGIAWRARSVTGSCALTETGAAWCWGHDEYGQLGNGTATSSLAAQPVPVSGGLTFASLSQGARHNCGVTAAGELWCWGNNMQGELGVGDQSARTTPVRVGGGLTFTSVAAGDEYTCGLVASGAAYCWGYNHYGELGDGTDTTRLTPVPVAGGLRFAALAAQRFHTCGVALDGSVWCWGDNTFGQLGTGDESPRNAPVQVQGVGALSAVSVSWDYTCGLGSGKVYCWGFIPLVANVGDGGLSYAAPTLMPMSAAAQALGVSQTTACASTAGAKLLCWGFVGAGPKPDNSSIVVDHPVAVGTEVPLVSFVVGSPYPCGVSADGTAWCYAYAESGTPAAGDTVRYLPKRIALY